MAWGCLRGFVGLGKEACLPGGFYAAEVFLASIEALLAYTMKPVGLMGATALESLAGFALTCECSHLSLLGSDLCVSCSMCLFSTFMGLLPLVLASLRCFAFLRACSPFLVSVSLFLISLHGSLV